MSAPLPGDKPAGYIGLIAGAIVIFGILYGMVQWTNGRFEGHAPPAAGTAPAGTTSGH